MRSTTFPVALAQYHCSPLSMRLFVTWVCSLAGAPKRLVFFTRRARNCHRTVRCKPSCSKEHLSGPYIYSRFRENGMPLLLDCSTGYKIRVVMVLYSRPTLPVTTLILSTRNLGRGWSIHSPSSELGPRKRYAPCSKNPIRMLTNPGIALLITP